jgi:hypothetical protein
VEEKENLAGLQVRDFIAEEIGKDDPHRGVDFGGDGFVVKLNKRHKNLRKRGCLIVKKRFVIVSSPQVGRLFGRCTPEDGKNVPVFSD